MSPLTLTTALGTAGGNRHRDEATTNRNISDVLKVREYDIQYEKIITERRIFKHKFAIMVSYDVNHKCISRIVYPFELKSSVLILTFKEDLQQQRMIETLYSSMYNSTCCINVTLYSDFYFERQESP